jgi:tyrosyl-tRNA synthetase
VYYKFLLLKTDEEIERLKAMHPMECKKSLAESLCAQFYGLNAAKHEREQFEKVFSKNDIPDDMPNFSIQGLMGKEVAPLVDILWATNLFPSRKEIRRLFEQGALKVDGQKITADSFLCKIPNEAMVVQAGKRIFFKITK